MQHNPTTGVRAFVQGERPQRRTSLTRDEVRKLAAEIPEQHKDLFWLVIYTGTRISEALAAKWQDIGHIDGQTVLNIPDSKTEAGIRTVPLSAEFSARLLFRRTAARFDSDTDPVFPSAVGTPMSAHNFRRRVFNPAAERAGVTATPHTLRHTHGSLMYAASGDIAQVAVRLGHEDPSFTLSTYVHAVDTGGTDFLDDLAA